MTPVRLFQHLRSIVQHPLTKGRGLEALLRYVGWQIGSRLVNGPVLVPFTDKAHLIVSPGMTGATCNIYTGMHDLAEMSFTAHLLRPGDLFLDVGANVGTYTVVAGAIAGARCIAFEPAPTAAESLRRNILINKIYGQVIQAAVGSAAGTVSFTVGLDSMNRVAKDGENSTITDVVALDDVTSTATLIKIDVEGFEYEVLLGANKLLQNPDLLAVIMETNGSGEFFGHTDISLDDRMKEFGFHVYSYDPFNRELNYSRPEKNGIYVRDKSSVELILKSAQKFKVLDHYL